MHKKFTSVITKENKWYVAHCLELGVVSQGKTIESAKKNLKEAVELYIESFGHRDLAKGTLLGILKQSGLTREELSPYLRMTYV